MPRASRRAARARRGGSVSARSLERLGQPCPFPAVHRLLHGGPRFAGRLGEVAVGERDVAGGQQCRQLARSACTGAGRVGDHPGPVKVVAGQAPGQICQDQDPHLTVRVAVAGQPVCLLERCPLLLVGRPPRAYLAEPDQGSGGVPGPQPLGERENPVVSVDRLVVLAQPDQPLGLVLQRHGLQRGLVEAAGGTRGGRGALDGFGEARVGQEVVAEVGVGTRREQGVSRFRREPRRPPVVLDDAGGVTAEAQRQSQRDVGGGQGSGVLGFDSRVVGGPGLGQGVVRIAEQPVGQGESRVQHRPVDVVAAVTANPTRGPAEHVESEPRLAVFLMNPGHPPGQVGWHRTAALRSQFPCQPEVGAERLVPPAGRAQRVSEEPTHGSGPRRPEIAPSSSTARDASPPRTSRSQRCTTSRSPPASGPGRHGSCWPIDRDSSEAPVP